MNEEINEKIIMLVKKNDKQNRIGWILEIPPIIILVLIFILLFAGFNEIIIIYLFFLNLSYLFIHLIYYGIINIVFYNKLGELKRQLKGIVVLKEPQMEEIFYMKCSYCGYETPKQFKKCSHCGAVL